MASPTTLFKGVFFLSVFSLVTYLVVFLPDTPFHPPATLKLGSGGYDTRPITAPVATGPLLELIAYALTGTRIGPFLRRSLLNANGFEEMRTLAEQVSEAPLYFPLHRLTAEEFNTAEEAALAATPLLTTPLDQLPRLEVCLSCALVGTIGVTLVDGVLLIGWVQNSS